MSAPSNLKDLVGKGLAGFRIVQMFGVYSLNGLATACGPYWIFKDEAKAKEFAERSYVSPYGQMTKPVLVLTDGTDTYFIEQHEPMVAYDDAETALADREKMLADRERYR